MPLFFIDGLGWEFALFFYKVLPLWPWRNLPAVYNDPSALGGAGCRSSKGDAVIESRRNVLVEVAREAGSCLRGYFSRNLEVKKKGELDLVTQADMAAESLVVDTIRQKFPEDEILAEEGGLREGGNGWKWILDPLDGTTNFAHRNPHFSVSIALAHNGETIGGVVYDPMKEEWFEAHAGEGATLNGAPIRVSGCERLNDALAVTGFSYDRRQRLPQLLDRVGRMLNCCQGLLRLGSAALDLAYIACGRLDVYLEDGLHPWDLAAGQLLVTEAGGWVSQLDGAPMDLSRGEVLAANQALAPQALAHLAP